MIVSTRGRYALRVMLDLVEHQTEERIPLKDISERQEVSQKYLESIMTLLSKNNLVDAIHGKRGGYRLNRKPEDYPVGEILRLTEGSLAPVACLESGSVNCERSAHCKTLPMWIKLDKLINDFFDSITLADLIS